MTFNNKKVLVTGCAGFIGSHLIRRLLELNYNVVGVDDFSTGCQKNIADICDKFTFIEGNLCDLEICKKACVDVKAILHQASIPSVPRSIVQPLDSLHSSVTATVTLLTAAVSAGVERFIQAGSSSVYGNSGQAANSEEQALLPLSPYAASKASQELFAQAFSQCHGIDAITLRYFNVFGPRQNPQGDYAAVIPKFILTMLGNQSPCIYGDGLQTRDFTYVENVVSGNIAALTFPERLGAVSCNLACGNQISLLDLVTALNKLLDKDLAPVFAAGRAGEVKHSRAEVSKIRRILGFTASIDFIQGLKETIDYYKSNS